MSQGSDPQQSVTTLLLTDLNILNKSLDCFSGFLLMHFFYICDSLTFSLNHLNTFQVHGLQLSLEEVDSCGQETHRRCAKSYQRFSFNLCPADPPGQRGIFPLIPAKQAGDRSVSALLCILFPGTQPPLAGAHSAAGVVTAEQHLHVDSCMYAGTDLCIYVSRKSAQKIL